MNLYPKVLLAAPTSQEKDYCFNDWAAMVKAIDYPNLDLLLVDNTGNLNYKKKLKDAGFNVIHQPRKPKEFPTSFVCNSMNAIRQYVLKYNYDYLFILETDVFIQPTLLKEMVREQLPVQNVAYFVDYIDGRVPCIQTFDHARRNMKMATKSMTNQLFTGQIIPFIDFHITDNITLIGSGYGCTLIDTEVLKYVKFRITPEEDKKIQKHTFPDTHFHLDLWKLGIANYLNTKHIAEHRNSQWTWKN